MGSSYDEILAKRREDIEKCLDVAKSSFETLGRQLLALRDQEQKFLTQIIELSSQLELLDSLIAEVKQENKDGKS